MLPKIVVRLFLWQLLVVLAKCDNLLVSTNSGLVRGVEQQTFLRNKTYISYKGIPFAQPPVGQLRFRVPFPITWQGTLNASAFGNSCPVISAGALFDLNSTQSEDCLYLNVYTPVLEPTKNVAKKAVLFSIFAGSFIQGDGTDGFYRPDFMIEDDIVIVTINHRLGPLGFTNFEVPGYTGNMGFKDQQLALEWTKQNIEYFGGDPNLITIYGESSGAVSSHLHMLSERSRKSMKRAIATSGNAFTYYAHNEKNNQIELLKQVFDLDPKATGRDVLNYMMTVSAEEIVQKVPGQKTTDGVQTLLWSAVVEDIEKAERPFLTRTPAEIYKTDNIDVEAMFGFASAEILITIDNDDPFSWIDQVKNYTIGLPFFGVTLSKNSSRYRAIQKEVYEYYFGSEELLPTTDNLNTYVQMGSDSLVVYPTIEVLNKHSTQSKTFCYVSDLNLNLNLFKVTNNFQKYYGNEHLEVIGYSFRAQKFSNLYDNIMSNLSDPINRKTLQATQFVTKMITDYVKTGAPGNFKPFTKRSPYAVYVHNDGLKQIIAPKKRVLRFWNNIYNSLKPWIVNPFA